MTEPILDPLYWKRRLEQAKRSELHHAVFKCPLERWKAIEAKHREILAQHIQPEDTILDAGCGYGRLLDLLPGNWNGHYQGFDLSCDLVAEATRKYGGFGSDKPHPGKTVMWRVGDLRNLSSYFNPGVFDWAILISIRPMIKRNLGNEVWAQMETELRRVASKLLYLEYDENDPGSVE